MTGSPDTIYIIVLNVNLLYQSETHPDSISIIPLRRVDPIKMKSRLIYKDLESAYAKVKYM